MKLGRLFKNKRFFIILLLVISGIIAITNGNYFLTKNKPIDTKTLVIEGWLPASDLELLTKCIDLNKYETIFVSGISNPNPYHLLNSNNTIVSGTQINLYSSGCIAIRGIKCNNLSNTLTIIAKGNKAYGNYSHFFIAIDDSIIGNSFLSENIDTFTFKIQSRLSDTSKIFISYNNDISFNNMDRNMIIKSIQFNNKDVSNNTINKIYNGDVTDRLYVNFPFQSNGHFAKQYLEVLGINKNIILVDTFFNRRNKTLASAIKLNSTINHSFKNIASYNVVSVDGHSSRSFIAYSLTSNKNINVGIISLNNSLFTSNNQENWILQTIDEYISYVFTYLSVVLN
jgi:hypothetical protein